MSKCKRAPNRKAIQLPRRNPLHNHPLLFKGAKHGKTNKAVRRKEKIAIKKEWLPQNIFLRVFFGEASLVIANK